MNLEKFLIKITMKKVIITLGLLLLFIPVLAYVASPYVSIYNFVKALQAGDQKILQEHMDFPAVRSSVQHQVNKAMQKNIKRNKYNPLAILGIAVTSTVVNGMVECILTPAGLSEIIQYGDLQNPLEALNGYKIPVVAKSTQVKKAKEYNFDMIKSIGFSGFNKFIVKIAVQKNTKPVVLIFVRQDFAWLLKDIDISGILEQF